MPNILHSCLRQQLAPVFSNADKALAHHRDGAEEDEVDEDKEKDHPKLIPHVPPRFNPVQGQQAVAGNGEAQLIANGLAGGLV